MFGQILLSIHLWHPVRPTCWDVRHHSAPKGTARLAWGNTKTGDQRRIAGWPFTFSGRILSRKLTWHGFQGKGCAPGPPKLSCRAFLHLSAGPWLRSNVPDRWLRPMCQDARHRGCAPDPPKLSCRAVRPAKRWRTALQESFGGPWAHPQCIFQLAHDFEATCQIADWDHCPRMLGTEGAEQFRIFQQAHGLQATCQMVDW